MVSGINTIYDTGALYDDIHWWKKNDMDFWSTIILDKNPKSVLELACGTGRLANLFLRENIHYTGIDIVPDFIKTANNKVQHNPHMATFVKGDIKKFNLKKNFDLIFIAFNSFLHLLTNDDIVRCLSQVKNHMHNKSCFVIDIFIPNPLFLYKPKDYRSLVLEFIDSNINQRVYVNEINNYNPETDINDITWYFSTKDSIDYDIKSFSMRMLFPSTINQILIDQGFVICNQWGNYDKTKLHVDSKLQIYDLMLNCKQ